MVDRLFGLHTTQRESKVMLSTTGSLPQGTVLEKLTVMFVYVLACFAHLHFCTQDTYLYIPIHPASFTFVHHNHFKPNQSRTT